MKTKITKLKGNIKLKDLQIIFNALRIRLQTVYATTKVGYCSLLLGKFILVPKSKLCILLFDKNYENWQ